ncbi:MAG: hypothetical protein M1817_005540 [Caeruleum heppii]|nr:MAG: hypothetical protein M1817_005540 [Caeruleum heppii]
MSSHTKPSKESSHLPVTILPLNSTKASLPQSLAISESEDDPDVRRKYRPFLRDGKASRYGEDWTDALELDTVMKIAAEDLARTGGDRLKVLVLYGSLRKRSYSRLAALEASRILFRLGCDVRVYDPTGLPLKDDVQHDHEKVQELRNLSRWSDGHVWVSPEQHGNLTGIFKMQIDWIPLATGSVRPTQGRTLMIAQVSGGSQSFNAVNSLRILGRWMRMLCIPNQSSIAKAYTQFTEVSPPTGDGTDVAGTETIEDGRMISSSMRDRLVDCCEEFVKITVLYRPWKETMDDRYSERREREAKEMKEREKQRQLGTAVNGVNLGSI